MKRLVCLLFASCFIAVVTSQVVASNQTTRKDGHLVHLDNGLFQGNGGSEQSRGEKYRTRRTRLDSSLGNLEIHLVEHYSGRRVKRFVTTRKRLMWPNDIPYVIRPDYPEDATPVLKRVLRYISSRLCVRFHDVTNTYDKADPGWFKKKGYEVNVYIEIGHGGGCKAAMGVGSKKSGPRMARPCIGFSINLHEMLHSLGGIHGHSQTDRDSYITIQPANIRPRSWKSYKIKNERNSLSLYFDPRQALAYGNRVFSSNGLETYFFIRDDLASVQYSNEDSIFAELNEVYKCGERLCKTSRRKWNCDPGYLTRLGGKCRCVCPRSLDPGRQCKRQFNGPNRFIRWPKTPMTVVAVDGKCPYWFTKYPGRLPLTGRQQPFQWNILNRLPSNENTVYLDVCSKIRPRTPSESDWESWQFGGRFCMIKPSHIDCGENVFDGAVIEMKTSQISQPKGLIGDVQVNGTTVTMKFCCSGYNPPWKRPIYLPDAKPFRLLVGRACPIVAGMRATISRFIVYPESIAVTGAQEAKLFVVNQTFRPYHCLYTPPKYGCNKMAVLDKRTPQVRFITENISGTQRRCFYDFVVPKKSKLRLTLNSFEINQQDDFFMKRYHKWLDPYRIPPDTRDRQFITVFHYLSLEFWSSGESKRDEVIDFTVDLLLPEDFCYDFDTNGADYRGDKSVTETYDQCIPWVDAMSCDDFPSKKPDTFFMLLRSGNACRNPDGKLLQPWCYTYVNGSECMKRYCDACNFVTPIDKLQNCPDRLAADPNFCTDAEERLGCFKSCGFPTQNSRADTVIPARRVGNCHLAMASFPDFCNDIRFKLVVNRGCARACGKRRGRTRCVAPRNPTYKVAGRNRVKTGRTITFACRPGLYHVSGNLVHACSSTGHLLGEEPVCRARPMTQDLQRNKIRSRHDALPKNLAVLFVRNDYRIPFDGKITRWFYYCTKPGVLHFLVYRPHRSSYRFIGSNKIRCEAGFKFSYKVSSTEQISVQKNDVFGIYSPNPDTLSVSFCVRRPVYIMESPTANAATFRDLLVDVGRFQMNRCIVPSLGLRLEPNVEDEGQFVEVPNSLIQQ